jgi:hypothetical protein
MHVEIDVYSGRPNPSFELSEPLSKEFTKKLENLPRAASAPPEPGLGYRGFVVTLDAGNSGAPQKVRVFGGFISFEKGTDVETFIDRNGAEAWLKEQAARAGHGPLVQ